MGQLRVEINLDFGIFQDLVDISGEVLDAVLFGHGFELLCVASQKDRYRHQLLAGAERDAALFANCENRSDQMLIGAHPSGNAIHGYTNCFHMCFNEFTTTLTAERFRTSGWAAFLC